MPSPAEQLQHLTDLELITPELRDRALTHEELDRLGSDAGPAETLAWMVFVDLYPEESFLQDVEAGEHAAWLADERKQAAQQVRRETLAFVHAVKETISERMIETLSEEGLIDAAQKEKALADLPEGQALASPEAALVWMVTAGHITPEEWQALNERAAAPSDFAADKTRAQRLAEAGALLAQVHQMVMRAHRKAFWSAVFPGPAWLWLGGGALALAGLIWYAVIPSAPPKCDSDEVQTSLTIMLMKARTSTAYQRLLRGGLDTPDMPSVSEVKEVGYAKVDQVRGCLATLTTEGEAMPYAFTIRNGSKSQPEDDDSYSLVGANPVIVQARFSNIDGDGAYAMQAEPVGRKNLEDAIRAGVAELRQTAGSDAMLETLRRVAGDTAARDSALSRTDPDREREIAEVEPVSACTALTAGQRYRCRVLIEHNHPVMAALGRGGSAVFEGEFTLERDGGQGWRVSKTFAEEFAEALTRERTTPGQ